MQNSMVIAHANPSYHTTSGDLFQTYTGDEICFLSATTQTFVPKTVAIPNSYCAGCDEGQPMLTAEKAAIVCQCSRRLIYRWIEEGSLHYRELPDGTVLVCGVTLAAKLEQLEDATGHLAR